MKNVHPWFRFFARFIDVTIWGEVVAIINFVFIKYYPTSYLGLIIYYIFILALWPIVEALLLYLFGKTPGKWIYNITVLSNKGEKISYMRALARSYNVHIYGQGLMIPFVNLYTHNKAYGILTGHGKTTWDKKYNLHIKFGKMGYIRKILLVIFYIVFIAGR